MWSMAREQRHIDVTMSGRQRCVDQKERAPNFEVVVRCHDTPPDSERPLASLAQLLIDARTIARTTFVVTP